MTLVRRHPRLVAGLAVLVLLAVVVGVLGGWARAEPEGPRTVRAGEETRAAPFRIRLDRAEAVYELADGTVADEGHAYVVVEGTLSLDDDESVGGAVVGELVRADLPATYDFYGNRQEEAEPTVTVAADGSALLGIGPGLTYAVDLLFELDESDVPEEVTFALFAQTRRRSFIDGTPGWFDPAVVGRLTLDVTPLPAERPADEDPL